MATTFKKGEQVTYISIWNAQGAVRFTQAVVQSCGMKRMTLANAETGAMMGRDFTPLVGFQSLMAVNTCASEGRPDHHFVRCGTFKAMTDEQALTFCRELAGSFVEYERKRLDLCIEQHANNAGYCAAIRKDIAALQASGLKR